jgi:O-antigen/teichoic acid export membrane protein
LTYKLFRRITSERFQRIGREFTWISIGQVVGVLASLFGVRIITELLTPEAYGQVALGMTLQTLMFWVVLGPLSNGATRFYAAAVEAGQLNSYLNAVIRMVLSSTVGILLVSCLTGFGMFFVGQSQWISFGIAALLFAILSGYNSMLNGIQNAARQRVVVALHQGAASWSRFLFTAGLIMWFGATSTVAMLGYGVALLPVLASQYYFSRRYIILDNSFNLEKSAETKLWQTKIFTYAWPFATWGVIGWLALSMDRWALQFFASTKDVGIYAVLFQLGYYPMTLLATLVSQLLKPIYFQRAGDGSDHTRILQVYILGRKIVGFAIIGTIIITIAAFYFHHWIFSLLVAKEYIQASGLLPGMVLAGGVYVSGQFGTALLQTQQKTNLLILPKNLSHFIGMLAIIIGAALFGVPGVVSARILHASIHLVWIVFLIRKQYILLSVPNVA